jgi:hypothetical protein
VLAGGRNFLINTGIIQGHLLTMNERPFFKMVHLISLHGSRERYLLTNLAHSKFGVPSCLISFLSYLSLQCQSDLSMVLNCDKWPEALTIRSHHLTLMT